MAAGRPSLKRYANWALALGGGGALWACAAELALWDFSVVKQEKPVRSFPMSVPPPRRNARQKDAHLSHEAYFFPRTGTNIHPSFPILLRPPLPAPPSLPLLTNARPARACRLSNRLPSFAFSGALNVAAGAGAVLILWEIDTARLLVNIKPSSVRPPLLPSPASHPSVVVLETGSRNTMRQGEPT